jgi:hypothetical protein
MDNRNDLNKALLVLFVLFFAIVLKEATTGTFRSAWMTLTGAIIIGLSLFALLFSDQKRGGDIVSDPDVGASEGGGN